MFPPMVSRVPRGENKSNRVASPLPPRLMRGSLVTIGFAQVRVWIDIDIRV